MNPLRMLSIWCVGIFGLKVFGFLSEGWMATLMLMLGLTSLDLWMAKIELDAGKVPTTEKSAD